MDELVDNYPVSRCETPAMERDLHQTRLGCARCAKATTMRFSWLLNEMTPAMTPGLQCLYFIILYTV